MGCAVAGCESEDQLKKGFCTKHYTRFLRYGDPLGGPRGFNIKYLEGQMCAVEGCDRPIVGRRVCRMHYARLRKHGSVDSGKFHHSKHRREWHPQDSTGYMWRYDPGNEHGSQSGYVYQHREVMGKVLGRRLLKIESVHHRNGDRTDNNLQNLEVWLGGQHPGQRVVDLVAYAKEILARYTPEKLELLESRGAGS